MVIYTPPAPVEPYSIGLDTPCEIALKWMRQNIGPCDDLVPPGNEPLSEPMLA